MDGTSVETLVWMLQLNEFMDQLVEAYSVSRHRHLL